MDAWLHIVVVISLVIVLVINYYCPNHLEDYIHRVGRTGRAGRKGTSYTFITQEEEMYAPDMVKALEKAGKSIPQMSDDEKKAFFNKIDAAWKGKGEKKES